MTREELLKVAKPMMVNSEVAKTMDRKTQTRRLIKDQNLMFTANGKVGTYEKPRWKKGDVLWVREPAKTIRFMTRPIDKNIALNYKYTSDGVTKWVDIPDRIKNGLSQWFLERERGVPNGCIKEMARTFLKVTNVRVERLQDISDEDCLAEGICEVDDNDCAGNYKVYTIGVPNIQNGIILSDAYNSAFEAYESLWDSTAPKGYKMKDNPYVFVYEFERVEATE